MFAAFLLDRGSKEFRTNSATMEKLLDVLRYLLTIFSKYAGIW